MLKSCLILCSILYCFGQINAVLDPKVVCYYDNWLTWRTDESKITVTDVDSTLCTHIVYGYLGVTSGSKIFIDDPDLLIKRKDLEHFTGNKGSAKALLSLGGWGYSQDPDKKDNWVSNLLNHPVAFVDDVMDFMKTYGFDGITIDWSRDVWTDSDMSDYVKVLKALRSEFGTRYTLAVTLGATTVRYDVKSVSELVDFITVQTIDYHGNWDDSVDFAAPIDSQLTTMNRWYTAGASQSKLIMTIPFYAHTWTLKDSTHSEPGAPAKGPGVAGPWTKAAGKLGYNEICTGIIAHPSSWKITRDTKSQSIYAVYGDQWISFEDPLSLEEKTRSSTSQGYGGVTVQALENDDFRNLCNQGKWSLLKGVQKGLDRTPVTRPPVTDPPIPTSDPTAICKSEGLFKDPTDCHVYHNCIQYFPGVYTDEIKHCDNGQGFDDKLKKCVEESLVPGCH
ncbi:chitinase-like mite allergen Der f 18.0101 [Oppia nitens]|uniref:chitinase-like mite allergen Der f 18.0101 n=1 Tax=Oppia nitens TaxID=1686743 RepID=UPI0023DBD13D|nr:chitinase-like mite allergen Der f 18.0101 [Oppia nitens]